MMRMAICLSMIFGEMMMTAPKMLKTEKNIQKILNGKSHDLPLDHEVTPTQGVDLGTRRKDRRDLGHLALQAALGHLDQEAGVVTSPQAEAESLKAEDLDQDLPEENPRKKEVPRAPPAADLGPGPGHDMLRSEAEGHLQAPVVVDHVQGLDQGGRVEREIGQGMESVKCCLEKEP